MTGIDNLTDMDISLAETEIRDLKKFWDDISWWERDVSLNLATEWLKIPSLNKITSEQINKIETLKKESALLWDSNKRPSKFKLMVGLVPNETWKPDYRMCLHKMMTLSNEELVMLGEYLNISEIETFKNDRDALYNLYVNLGQNYSQATFYAFRNYLGKGVSD
jgi:hypothetical protein